MKRNNLAYRVRCGSVLPLMLILLVPLLALTALAIDVSYLALTRSQLQNAADAAATAAATEILTNRGPNDQNRAHGSAREFAQLNRAAGASVEIDSSVDVTFGYWNTVSRQFEAPRMAEPNVKINAVRVVARREKGSPRGAVPTFFAGVIGISSAGLRAESIAYIPNPSVSQSSSGNGTRFLIDDELLDTDEPSVVALANSLKTTPEYLLSARNEKSSNPKDWFLNLPPGSKLDLPTGQVGDEGLLDISANNNSPGRPQYPFTSQADHTKFLMYNNTSENDAVSRMRKSLFTDSQLDPLPGVGRFNQPSQFPALVNPDFVHVSPIFKSDVSALDGTDRTDKGAGADLNNDGVPDGYTTNKPVEKGVNAKDYRRGLLAFKIIGYSLDSKNPYPSLPKLTLEIVDPATIDLNNIPPLINSTSSMDYKAGGAKNVRIAQ
jgi:Flp pilus assembly protein TadG